MAEININTGETSVSGSYRRKHRSAGWLVWVALFGTLAALVGLIVYLAQRPPANQRALAATSPAVDRPNTLSVAAPHGKPPAAKTAEEVEAAPIAAETDLLAADRGRPNDQLAAAVAELDTLESQPAKEPAAEAEASDTTAAAATLADPPANALLEDELYELYASGRMCQPKSYQTLRRIYAERFAHEHSAEIEAALDGDNQRWLAEHSGLREELFTALDPTHDDVTAALEIFASLRREFPETLPAYANLAIAVAVVWDNPAAVYDYVSHQKRVGASLPDDRLGARENYEYLLETESGQYLPWEFLIYTIDHRTPLEERQWAVKHYLPKRRLFGKCYSDVPYDQELIDSNEAIAALRGAPYTLANLRELGGVCAHQADFAARVGKSLGVPAVFTGGQASNQDHHAWVMWVELEAVGPNNIAFHLESSGRYFYDKYYVGDTRDPQTGQQITDRQLELRLHTVGMDPQAKRQADRLMTAYPELLESQSLGALDCLNYLAEVTELCPGNTAAWRELAKLAGREDLTRGEHRVLGRGIDQLFSTFRDMPDFTWEVFDDLIRGESQMKKRLDAYDRLIGMYVAAERPDLASQARLRQATLYEEQGQPLAAARALAPTILALADDGRYAPPLFDRMEALCKPLDGGLEFLDEFYPQYLRKIPTHRGRVASPYAIAFYRRAIQWYTLRQRPDYVAELERRLAALEAG